MKMKREKNHDSRIALRISKTEKQRIFCIVQDGEAKNVSQIIRDAVKEFLERRSLINAAK
jgi:Arc/MetJ-type ribon-helix-helix transcriptional regulator